MVNLGNSVTRSAVAHQFILIAHLVPQGKSVRKQHAAVRLSIAPGEIPTIFCKNRRVLGWGIKRRNDSDQFCDTFRQGNVFRRCYSDDVEIGGVVNKAQWRSRAFGAIGVIALVLVTNECYRYGRAVFDYVTKLETEVASLTQEVRSLKGQIGSIEGQGAKAPVAIQPVAMSTLPMPLPINPVPIAPPEPAARPVVKARSAEDATNLVSVILMSEPKISAEKGAHSVTPVDVGRPAVKLLGEGT
jgi:hypothetical protein